jgi:hypothetical protein
MNPDTKLHAWLALVLPAGGPLARLHPELNLPILRTN